MHLGEDALHFLQIDAAATVEAHAVPLAFEELGPEMLFQGANAVAHGGGGDAELLAGKDIALVSGGGFEEAQAFERGQEWHGEGPDGARWENVSISSQHICAPRARSCDAFRPAAFRFQPGRITDFRREGTAKLRSRMPW